MLSVIMLNVAFYFFYTECLYAKYHYAGCRLAECHYAECRSAILTQMHK
jgi:hypothetical protein